MSSLTNGIFEQGILDLGPAGPQVRQARKATPADGTGHRLRDAEFLRRCAWEIGERRPAEAHSPTEGHVGLAAVTPYEGFAHWRMLPEWVDHVARQRGHAWHHCRPVLRLY